MRHDFTHPFGFHASPGIAFAPTDGPGSGAPRSLHRATTDDSGAATGQHEDAETAITGDQIEAAVALTS